MQARQHITRLYLVAMIRIQLDEGGADLEADFREDTRLDRAEAEDLYWPVLDGPGDLDRQGRMKMNRNTAPAAAASPSSARRYRTIRFLMTSPPCAKLSFRGRTRSIEPQVGGDLPLSGRSRAR